MLSSLHRHGKDHRGYRRRACQVRFFDRLLARMSMAAKNLMSAADFRITCIGTVQGHGSIQTAPFVFHPCRGVEDMDFGGDQRFKERVPGKLLAGPKAEASAVARRVSMVCVINCGWCIYLYSNDCLMHLELVQWESKQLECTKLASHNIEKKLLEDTNSCMTIV